MTAFPHVMEESASILKLPNTQMLNGLRGFFALCVFSIHLDTSRYLYNYLGFKMQAVVMCFFVISSFLLTFSCLSWKPSLTTGWRFRMDAEFWNYWGAYFIRRFIKIYPLYIIVISLACSNRTASEAFWGLVTFWNHALFIQGLSAFWTIVIEWDFYYVLPVIVISFRVAEEMDMRRGRVSARKSVLLFFSTISMFITFCHPISSYVFLYYHLTPYFPVFWAGSFGAILYREALRTGLIENVNMEMDLIVNFRKRKVNISSISNKFCWLSLFLLFITQPHFLLKLGFSLDRINADIAYRNFVGTKSAYICTIVVVLMISFVRRRSFNRFFEWSFFIFMGKISYPFYLFHLIVSHSVSKYTYLKGFDGLLVIFSVSVLLGYLLQRLIEEPCIQWGQMLIKFMRRKCKKDFVIV